MLKVQYQGVMSDAEFLTAAARPVVDKTLSQGPAFGCRAFSNFQRGEVMLMTVRLGGEHK